MKVANYKGADLLVYPNGTWSAVMDGNVLGKGFQSMDEAKKHVDKHYGTAGKLEVYLSSGSYLVKTEITSLYHSTGGYGPETQARYKTGAGGTSVMAFHNFYEVTPNNDRVFAEMAELERQIRELELKRRDLHLQLDGKLSLERYRELVGVK